MVNNLSFNKPFKDLIEPFKQRAPDSKYWKILSEFLEDYEKILEFKNLDKGFYYPHLQKYTECVFQQITSPFPFEPFHKAIRAPFDHHEFGKIIFKPLIDIENSKVFGLENLEKILKILENGENVVIFANHQTEIDPQAIAILTEEKYKKFSDQITFVAGERVVTDALAVPFSLGTNLFCVYSKKYFDVYPDRKATMLEHNKRTMLRLGEHLDSGSECIGIFPSGGRDRPDDRGKVRVAKFDPQSVELLYLLGRKAKTKTHYFPLALSTHDILPPPRDLQVDLGEKRKTKEAPVYLHFGEEIDMENFPSSDTTDRILRKNFRADHIWQTVCNMYDEFPS
jgi:glycerol-3-phosphate O-acyltransferase